MKYLVVSDNHSDREILVDLKNEFENQVDLFLHCGDSELPETDPLWETFQVVCGNCDYGGGFPNERIVKTPLDTIYMTHGHLADVRFGVTKLGLKAQQADASIALFGHTHQIGCEVVEGVLYLNPGSISQPRGPIQIPSYALIEHSGEQVNVQYYNRAHQPVEELAFTFSL